MTSPGEPRESPRARETRTRAIARLDVLIAEMSKPLPRWQQLRGWHERNGGWVEESRREWLERLEDLRQRLHAGEQPVREAQHLVRWLDHSGVVGGRWLEQAAQIQDDLHQLVSAVEEG